MTTITIKDDSIKKKLQKEPYSNYKDLMEDLAEMHGYIILWELADEDLPKSALEALKMHKEGPKSKLYNL